MLSDHLEGWDREGGRHKREEIWGYMYVHIADSLCYTAETNTPLESNYTPVKIFKKKTNRDNKYLQGGHEETRQHLHDA